MIQVIWSYLPENIYWPIKVEYYAYAEYENLFQNSEKIIFQRLMSPIMENNYTLPHWFCF